MAKTYANLDALIERENFEAGNDSEPSELRQPGSVILKQLENGQTYRNILRKPDFQRETASWEPEKIVQLVKSFVSRHLIPPVILWESPEHNIFVIDGAHRLSAIIAWIADDYGDRDISTAYFRGYDVKTQKDAAQATRELMAREVGTYAMLSNQKALESADPEVVTRAKNIAFSGIPTLWIPGDADVAEKSFFTMNQQATAIDPVELVLIENRNRPNAIAARALLRAGTGSKLFWSEFSTVAKQEIEQLASGIHARLFVPEQTNPLTSLDQPLAGAGYSLHGLRLVWELVNFVNRVTDFKALPEDRDGAATLKLLRAVDKATKLVFDDTYVGSLGLHPFVYFYSATGTFQPTALLSAIRFFGDLEAKNKLVAFSRNRERFEEFLFANRHFSNEISKRHGAWQRGVLPTIDMFTIVLEGAEKGLDGAEIMAKVIANSRLNNLAPREQTVKTGARFPRGTKNAARIAERMAHETRCPVCNARVFHRAYTNEHMLPIENGGVGSEGNAGFSHPFCNGARKAIGRG